MVEYGVRKTWHVVPTTMSNAVQPIGLRVGFRHAFCALVEVRHSSSNQAAQHHFLAPNAQALVFASDNAINACLAPDGRAECEAR